MPRAFTSIVAVFTTLALTITGCRSGSDSADGSGAASQPTGGNAGASAAGSQASEGGRGGAPSSAGAGTGTGGGSDAGRGSTPCEDTALVWKTANKTNYTSYPDPGSEECVKYNGCMWAGQFAACDDKKSETWVSEHDIVAAFPDFDALELHDLCLRRGGSTLVVTVLDTCADSDCSGCCTQNQGSADELIDVESFTNARFGVDDGPIEWADLGPTRGSGCN
jgi:hypothetical protein